MNKLIGITRVRNEALLIQDTIAHFLEYCDEIILYDDCSTDDTIHIAASAGNQNITIISGDQWRKDRMAENTRHRAILLQAAKDQGAEWCLCFDADERLVGTLPVLKGDGYVFRLFDGYLTENWWEYYQGTLLEDLPRMWGPEHRDILMLFRTDLAQYVGTGRREPKMPRNAVIGLAPIKVKHFGKCMSVEHWEETCDYYANSHFPKRMRDKWANRRGKAIHTKSDFGRGLYEWDDLMLSPLLWRLI